MQKLKQLVSAVVARDAPGASPDHYTVRRSSLDSGGGWQNVEGWTHLDDPITKQRFRLNVDQGVLEPGTYRQLALVDGQIQLPDAPHDWSWQPDIDPADDQADPELERVLAQIEAHLADQQPEEPPQTPPDPADALKYQALRDETFMEQFGEELALSVWGLHDGPGAVDRERFVEQPFSALLYTAYQNPPQLQRFGRHLGATIGAVARGFESGYTTSPTTDDPTHEPEAGPTDGQDRAPTLRDSDAVDITFDDLGSDTDSSIDPA